MPAAARSETLATRPLPRRRRGGLPLALLALLPLSAFAVFAVVDAMGSIRAAEQARLRGAAQALAAAVDARIYAGFAALRGFGVSPLFDDPADPIQIEARARDVAEALGGWIVFLGPPPEHRLLANSLRGPGRPLPSPRPTEVKDATAAPLTRVFAEGRPGVSDVFDGPLRGRPVFLSFLPLLHAGRATRALALGQDTAALQALLAQQDLPAGTVAAIVDRRMQVVAHSNGDAAMPTIPAAWRAALQQGEQRGMVSDDGADGAADVAFERLTMAEGWTVVVSQPLEAGPAAAWRELEFLLAAAAALMVALLGAIWMNRRLALRDALHEAAALRAGRAEVERLHAAMPVLIFLRDIAPDGSSRLLYRAGDLEAVTGWPADELARHDNLMKAFGDAAPDCTLRFQRTALDEGRASVEWRFRQPDGSWRHVLQAGRILTRRADGGAELVGYLLDVTAERAAQARAEAAGRLAALGELSAGLAHELRQPLQAILLSAENAQRVAASQGDAALGRRLARIVAQADRAGAVIDELRRFARGAEGAGPPVPVSLARSVERALSLVGHSLREAGIAVEIDLGAAGPWVLGQALPIEQVLTNLLLNARDALVERPPGAARRIRITARNTEDGVTALRVADTGGGIAPDLLPRLFQPFVTTKSPETGTGLGLSICHGLMRAMGGEIEGCNDSEGAAFTLRLRRAEQVAPEVPAEMAGGPGFEPRLPESESGVLPLNYPPSGPGRGRGPGE